MVKPSQERRKYLRARTPLKIRIISEKGVVHETQTKDISPLGLRFATEAEGINANDSVELKIDIPNVLSPIHAVAKVVWKKKLSMENGSPIDIGCEFAKIEEDNKNTFLKYFCDLLYGQEV